MKTEELISYINDKSSQLSMQLIKEAEANVHPPIVGKEFIPHEVLKKRAGEEMQRGIENLRQNFDVGIKAIFQIIEKHPDQLTALKNWLAHHQQAIKKFLQNESSEIDSEAIAEKLNLPDELLDAMYQAVLKIVHEQRYDEAAAAILLCISFQPKVFSFWLTYGTILQRQKEYQSALYIFQTALIFNENSPVPYAEMAKSWIGLSARTAALDYLKKAIELSLHKPEYEEFLDYCYGLQAYAQALPPLHE